MNLVLGVMMRIVGVLLALFLFGCVTHRVEVDAEWTLDEGEDITITQVNEYPEGFQCFEPLLYVLSLGIVPAQCRDTYQIELSSEEGKTSQVRVTTTQGWLSLFLAISRNWQFGHLSDPEAEIESRLRPKDKDAG